MTTHTFNKGDYITLRFFYSVKNRPHSLSLGFTINTGCSLDPIFVARYIYNKLFKEIIYSTWATPVSPQYLIFYYGEKFLKLASLDPLVDSNAINPTQFFRFYLYIINQEKPVALNIYGISRIIEDDKFLQSFKKKLEDFLTNTITIPAETSDKTEMPEETSDKTEMSEETSNKTFLRISFAGVRLTPQIISLDEISSVDLKVLKLPKNQADLLIQGENTAEDFPENTK